MIELIRDVDAQSVLFAGFQAGDGRVYKSQIQVIEGEIGNGRVEMIGVSDKPQNVKFEKQKDGSIVLSNSAYIGRFRTHIANGLAKPGDERILQGVPRWTSTR